MTNAQIVMAEQFRLMEEGIIGTTGRELTFVDDAGNETSCMEPEAIHTFATWKQLGYKVKKGSKAVAQFPIWKYRAGKKEVEMTNVETGQNEKVEVDNSKMFMKMASWFSASQVELA